MTFVMHEVREFLLPAQTRDWDVEWVVWMRVRSPLRVMLTRRHNVGEMMPLQNYR